MRHLKIKPKKVLEAIKSHRWVDGTAIDSVEYVWPDEGTWIVAEMLCTSGTWIDDTPELYPDFIGDEPVRLKAGVYEEKYCKWYDLEAMNSNKEYCSYICYEALYRIPDGTMILERRFNEAGKLCQRIIISMVEGNPQPRFDFNTVVVEKQLLPLAA